MKPPEPDNRYVVSIVVFLFMLTALCGFVLYQRNASRQKSRFDEHREPETATGPLPTRQQIWHDLAVEAVAGKVNGSGFPDFNDVLFALNLEFHEDTAKTAREFHAFIQSQERDDVGRVFIDILKNDGYIPDPVEPGYVNDAGRFLSIAFYSTVIFGNPAVREYAVEKDSPAIIFGPDSGCVMTGGDSFDFLIGGDGDDILDGGGNGAHGPGVFIRDILAGGGGDDVYVFPSRGNVQIRENPEPSAGRNTIRIGENINREELRLIIGSYGDLHIVTGGLYSGEMWIENWASQERNTGIYAWLHGSAKAREHPPIQAIEFSDGSRLGVQDILDLAND